MESTQRIALTFLHMSIRIWETIFKCICSILSHGINIVVYFYRHTLSVEDSCIDLAPRSNWHIEIFGIKRVFKGQWFTYPLDLLNIG